MKKIFFVESSGQRRFFHWIIGWNPWRKLFCWIIKMEKTFHLNHQVEYIKFFFLHQVEPTKKTWTIGMGNHPLNHQAITKASHNFDTIVGPLSPKGFWNRCYKPLLIFSSMNKILLLACIQVTDIQVINFMQDQYETNSTISHSHVIDDYTRKHIHHHVDFHKWIRE